MRSLQDELFQARVVNRDPSNDLALLKVEGGGFAWLPLGDALDVRSGEAVFTVEFTVATDMGVNPKMRSAPLFQLVMMLLRSLPMIASSELSTIAARRRTTKSKC
jgi:hypothetical protein